MSASEVEVCGHWASVGNAGPRTYVAEEKGKKEEEGVFPGLSSN
jgi:hypothetical protein